MHRGLAIAAIGLEASGGYERGVMRALLAAGLPACQVNPFKLRQFAHASGVLAKNDPLDTCMIASFVAVMPRRPAQPRPPAIGWPRCWRFAVSSTPRGRARSAPGRPSSANRCPAYQFVDRKRIP